MSALQPRPIIGAPGEWRWPEARRTTLDNGLTVVIHDLPGKPMAAAVLVADAPTDADPAGREGLATLVARTLDEGTTERDAEAFADALEREGASLHAGADSGGLRVALDVPAGRLPATLPLLAEALARPTFPEDEVGRVRGERLDQIRQEYANPAARAALALRAAVWAEGSRAALPGGGTAESVARLTRDEVAGFWADRAAPATSTLVLAGDLTGLDVDSLLGATLGSWSAPAREKWTPTTPVGGPGPRVVVVDRPGAVQTQLALGRPSIDRRHPDWPAVTLAAYILGGTLTSRIDAVLREEKGYTYGMRARVQPGRRAGSFVVSGAVDTPSTGPAVADLFGVLRTAAAGGARDEERTAAADYLTGVSPLRWETPRAVADQASVLVADDLPHDWVDEFLAGMRRATTGDVSAALASHLRPDELILVAVGDADQVAGPLADCGLGAVEVLDA